MSSELMRRLDAGAPGFEAELAALLDRLPERDEEVRVIVAGIISEVRRGGDAAKAQKLYDTRHFMIDHDSGLEPLLAEIDAGFGDGLLDTIKICGNIGERDVGLDARDQHRKNLYQLG